MEPYAANIKGERYHVDDLHVAIGNECYDIDDIGDVKLSETHQNAPIINKYIQFAIRTLLFIVWIAALIAAAIIIINIIGELLDGKPIKINPARAWIFIYGFFYYIGHLGDWIEEKISATRDFISSCIRLYGKHGEIVCTRSMQFFAAKGYQNILKRFEVEVRRRLDESSTVHSENIHNINSKAFQSHFNEKEISVDDRHIIVGYDFFRLQDIEKADVSTSCEVIKSRAKITIIASILTFICIVALISNTPAGYFWESILIGCFYGFIMAGIVASVLYALGFKNASKYTVTFRLLRKGGDVMLELTKHDTVRRRVAVATKNLECLVSEINNRLPHSPSQSI